MRIGLLSSINFMNLGNTGFLLIAITGTWGHTSGTTTVAGNEAGSPISSSLLLLPNKIYCYLFSI